MKIQNRIKLIGLICIVIGTSGMIWGIFIILMPQIIDITDLTTTEIPPSLQRWNVILTYIGILVNVIYLTAGILFLLKMPTSLRFMYIALVIVIMYQFIPMLFLHQYSAILYFQRYEFSFFHLIGPIFNAVLLVIVNRIGKEYYKPTVDYIEPVKEKIKQVNFLIYGYLLLIVSSAFMDVDIIALLAMPGFLISIGLILIFYISLISKDNPKRKLALSLIISGTILLAAVVGYSGVTFIENLRNNSRIISEEFFPSLWPIIGINILASLIILIGLKQSRKLNNRRLNLVWLPTLGLLPLVLMLIKVLKLYHFGI